MTSTLPRTPPEADGYQAPAQLPPTPVATLVELLDRTVARHGDQPAVSDDTGRTLTWRELVGSADELAAMLRAAGVGREDRVAVYRRRSVDLIVSVLGVVRAGAAYVTVDDRYPDTRCDEMLVRSGAVLVITDADQARPLPTTVFGHHAADRTPSAGPTVAPAAPAPTDAVSVLFTSGSTGEPKGVVLEHRNLVSWATRSAPTLQVSDRVAQVANVSFDAFHYELWCAAAAGARIVVMPSLPDLVHSDIRRELRRRGITSMLAPTMAVNHLVQADPDAFADLRVLCTGGDVVAVSACRDIVAGAFHGTMWNLYGPTEATTACTGFDVSGLQADATTVPIGHALDGARVYLLDADGNPVPEGTVGELHVGGSGVARGYLHDPVQTARRFTPDPFAADGSTMYATGDLGRRRGDVIEYVGRADHQVKIRGYRVEPGEVEHQLAGHPGVHDVAVLTAGGGADRRLVAVVVPVEELAPQDLRSFAEARMPDYLVPADILMVSEIPATTHGKRDRKALQELASAAAARRHTWRQPVSPTERWLAAVWEALLGVEHLGLDDDFFQLGGHSMLAFRVRRRIMADLNLRIDLQDVLANSVLGELAAFVDALAGAGVRA